MLFNSLEFLIFLPVVFVVYWFVFKPLRWQNLFIVVSSYVFYGWWNWHFLLLIAFTSFCSYLSGILIQYDRQNGGGAKCYASLNIIINLFILCVYKYYNFFAESLVETFSRIGIELNLTSLDIVLPVGISFYTFQALSYTIDVYRKKIEPTKDIIAFLAFISFFPQLVAGPIERATNLLPQFLKKRMFNYLSAVDGTKQILWGLFKKMVIADNCADIVDNIWGNYAGHSSLMLVVAAVLFAFQIYGDFSGYSDIAIGTARLFGISLMRNFNFPYFSRNVAEFWKRWHISLNTWFVDYVYIPLGGSRKGKFQQFRNTFIIFFTSGLWHGANWTFVLWGVYHALLFLPLMLIGKTKKYAESVAEDKCLPSIREFCMMLVTFILIVFGWIIFRANNVMEFTDYLQCIITNANVSEAIGFPKKIFFFIIILLFIEWINRTKQYGLQFLLPKRWMRWILYLLIAFIILTQMGKQVQFIYFQF
ncbi:MBOAT family O-acyltransferase [Phocaeicola sp.]